MENKIKKIMNSIFNIDSDQINDKTSPETLEEWDSLKHMNLILALEEEFDIEFSDEDISQMQSYALIKLIIEEKVIA